MSKHTQAAFIKLHETVLNDNASKESNVVSENQFDVPDWLETLYNVNPSLAARAEAYIINLMKGNQK